MDEALKEGGDEYRSIKDARTELVELLEQVEEAHKRLHLTQARVQQNVEKLTELKAEAAEFSRLKELSAEELPVAHPDSTDMLGAQSIAELDGAAVSPRRNGAVAPAPGQAGNGQRKRSKGLQSSLDLEAGLRNFWCDFLPRTSSVVVCMCFVVVARDVQLGHMSEHVWA